MRKICMNVLAIFPKATELKAFEPMPPLWMAWIAASIKEKVNELLLIDQQVDNTSLLELAISFKPDFILIGGTSHSRFEAFNLAFMIKKAYPPGIIVYGGPHASFTPLYTLLNNPSMITLYDRKNHGWELVLRKGAIVDGRFLNTLLIENSLYGFYPQSQREYEESFVPSPEPSLYRFDMETKTWERIKQMTGKAVSKMSGLDALAENDRWILNGNLLIDKTSLDGYIIKNPVDLRDNIREKIVFRIARDSLFGFRWRNHEIYQPVNLSINEIINHRSTIRFSLTPTPVVNKPWFWIALVLFLGAPTAALAGVRRRKRRSSDRQDETDNTTAIILQLNESERLVLSTEELDQILGIAHLTYDSRKQRRSIILRQVEEKQPNLITRERSEQDKCTYHYRIRKA